MNRFVMATISVAGLVSVALLPRLSYAQITYTGIVERVWEDGFRLDVDDRNLRVDAWNVYGDNTPNHIVVGDSITVTGEFDGGEFDAFSITNANAEAATEPLSAPMRNGQTSYTGTVERVWEDGFRLDAGDRTLRVDAWNVYGDNTPNNIAVGDSITVTGEFDGGEFDAFSITDAESAGR